MQRITKQNALYLRRFGVGTGMRQGELMGLQWRDVDLKNGVAILHETKNGERRRVPLSGLGLELLREYAKVRRIDTQLLFPSPTKPQQPIDLKKSWLNTLKKAEIENFHWQLHRVLFGNGWREFS
jgi:integrase